MENKAWYMSKMNYIGAFLVVLGLFSDPEFAKLVGQLIPAEYLSRITAATGVVVMIVRTFFTSMGVTLSKDGK